MRRKRPTSVLVIAILHFIFGGLGLLCGLPGLVMQASGMSGIRATPAGASRQQKEMQEMQEQVKKRTEREAPLQAPFVFGNVILNLLTSILLVVAGVGLVKLQPWGWYGSVVYGVARIIIQIYILIFNLIYSLPITGRILEEELRRRPTLQPFAFIFQIVTPVAIAVAVLGLIYPIIVLIFMSRPNVRAAFRGQPSEIEPVEDFDDEPTERLRRGDEYDDEARGYGDEADDRFRPSR